MQDHDSEELRLRATRPRSDGRRDLGRVNDVLDEPRDESGTDRDSVELAGFLFARPYLFAMVYSVPQRRAGMELVLALLAEFRAYSSSLLMSAVDSGAIRVNGARAEPTRHLHHGDVVSHLVHRHEVPVPALRRDLVVERDNDGGLLVIDKPAGWPVYAGGAYHKHTIEWLLCNAADVNCPRPRFLHRLDRQVSGLLLVATRSDAASAWSAALRREDSVKLYVARVAGNAVGELARSASVPLLATVRRLDQRIKPHPTARGRFEAGDHVCAPEGKHATTDMLPVAYDEESDTSVVLLRAVTGRTHQLRAHLLAASLPIANDPYYGGSVKYMQAPFDEASHGDVPPSWRVEHPLRRRVILADDVTMYQRDALALADQLPCDSRAAEAMRSTLHDVDNGALTGIIEHCPFCRRNAELAAAAEQNASDACIATACDAVMGAVNGHSSRTDLGSTLTYSFDGDDGNDDGDQCTPARRAGIWLCALSYTVFRTLRVPLPLWVPTHLRDVVESTHERWISELRPQGDSASAAAVTVL